MAVVGTARRAFSVVGAAPDASSVDRVRDYGKVAVLDVARPALRGRGPCAAAREWLTRARGFLIEILPVEWQKPGLFSEPEFEVAHRHRR